MGFKVKRASLCGAFFMGKSFFYYYLVELVKNLFLLH